jgi:archaetidylinositol phosphate synthase
MAKTRRKERAPRAHTRVIDTLTGPSERRVLRWLAAHLPAWVTPDHLTALSFFAGVVIAASYVLSRQNPIFLWLAIAGFILNWFGDSLDGTLARYRHIERPRYGFFIDHSVDALSEILIFFSIGLTIFVRFEIASVALVGYLALSLYTALSTYAASEFKISYAYLGPTEIRLIAMLATAWVYFNPTRFVNLLGGKFSFFELVTLGLIILFYSAFILSTAGQAIRLAQADKPHLPKKIIKPASRPTFFGGLQASLSKRLHSGRKIL